MAWYSSILNAAANPAAQQALSTAGTTGASMASLQGGTGTITLATGTAGQPHWQTSVSYDPISGITAYAKMIGWAVDHVYLPNGVDSNDPKVAILKLTNINEVIKDVGVRVSNEHYYVMRDPNASE
jgi:hypothetical protein